MTPLSCVHVVPSLASITGGPAVSVAALCGALAGLQVSVRLCTADDEWIAGQSVDPPSTVPVVRYGLGNNWVAHRVYRGQLSSVLMRMAWSSMVVHSHGIWAPESYFAARVAERSQRPHIISCRGMLDPWALQFRKVKKWIALAAYQRRILRNAAVLHATSSTEAQSIRGLGLRNPVAVISNGVGLDVTPKPLCRTTVDMQWPQLRGKPLLVFHSRLHRVKGLDELLEVWSEISPMLPDWVLVLAGHDEEQYARRYGLSSHQDANSRLVYLGHLPNALGKQLLGAASLTVLPSHSESFGNVIAESLAHSTPVITTTNTPWSGINRYEAGMCIRGNAAELRAALLRLCSLPEDELLRMGANGRRWMERSYSWGSAAEQLRDVYQWILGQGPKPECVLTADRMQTEWEKQCIPA